MFGRGLFANVGLDRGLFADCYSWILAAAGDEMGLESVEIPESDFPFLLSCRNTLSFTCTPNQSINKSILQPSLLGHIKNEFSPFSITVWHTKIPHQLKVERRYIWINFGLGICGFVRIAFLRLQQNTTQNRFTQIKICGYNYAYYSSAKIVLWSENGLSLEIGFETGLRLDTSQGP